MNRTRRNAARYPKDNTVNQDNFNTLAALAGAGVIWMIVQFIRSL